MCNLCFASILTSADGWDNGKRRQKKPNNFCNWLKAQKLFVRMFWGFVRALFWALMFPLPSCTCFHHSVVRGRWETQHRLAFWNIWTVQRHQERWNTGLQELPPTPCTDMVWQEAWQSGRISETVKTPEEKQAKKASNAMRNVCQDTECI